MFVYANRPITLLRARVLTDQPADRARVATEILDRMVEDGTAVGPVTASEASGVMILSVGGRSVLTLVPADLNLLAMNGYRPRTRGRRFSRRAGREPGRSAGRR